MLLLTAPGLALIAGGWYFFAAKRDCLSVEFTERQATFVTSGQQRWSAPLDEIVPLTIRTVWRSLPNSETRGAYRTEYRVVTAGARDALVYAAWTYRKARRAADRSVLTVRLDPAADPAETRWCPYCFSPRSCRLGCFSTRRGAR